jgi:hypothetical protein
VLQAARKLGFTPNASARTLRTHKSRILGVVIAGKNAGDLLLPWIIAVQKSWKIGEMTGLIFPYPTLSEVSKRVAVTHFGPLAGKPWIRRILGFLRKLG